MLNLPKTMAKKNKKRSSPLPKASRAACIKTCSGRYGNGQALSAKPRRISVLTPFKLPRSCVCCSIMRSSGPKTALIRPLNWRCGFITGWCSSIHSPTATDAMRASWQMRYSPWFCMKIKKLEQAPFKKLSLCPAYIV